MRKTLYRASGLYPSYWLSALILLFYPFLGTSQYSVGFSTVYGGSNDDVGISVDVDEDSGFVVCGGWSFSNDAFLHENAGGSDFWLMQMTPDGDTLWSRTYGGPNNDDLRAVKYDDNGGITAFGTTWSSGSGDVPNHMGQVGAWLLSMTMAGDPLLSVVFSGALGEQGIDFHPMNDGGYVLLIQSVSPELNGGTNHGNYDFWIARISPGGLIDWSRFYGGAVADIPSRILRIPGGFIVIGSTESAGGDVTENAGGYDYWILKLDTEGEIIWQKTFGGSDDDFARDVVVLPDGSIAVVGESSSLDGDRGTALGEKDIWLICVDEDGDLLWEKSYGGTDDDTGERISMLGQNSLLILANSKSSDGHLTGSKGRTDAWLAYMDLTGVIYQHMNYGGSMDDFGKGLTITEDSVVYMVGSSKSEDGVIYLDEYGMEDLWLLQMEDALEPCAPNDACFMVDQVNTAVFLPQTNGPLQCSNGCNAGAQKGPSGPPGCSNFPGAAAWFRVKTDADAEVMSIWVASCEISQPQILVLNGFNCANFGTLNCTTGSLGEASIIHMPVDPDTAYYIAVGASDGAEGRFDICVSVVDINFCNYDPKLYVDHTSLGSPPEGPFQPGEEVRICYEVTTWDKRDCNGLQGIVPQFAEGWDPESINILGYPQQIDTMLIPVSANGEWTWWPTANVTYNFTNDVQGYFGGQSLPAGWYFVNFDDPPPNDDPDESIGDLDNCMNDASRWKVCFTLRTIEDCTEDLDCSVTIKSFADGEIGAIVSQACQNDPPLTLNRYMNCCLGPRISAIPDFTICSGDTVIIDVSSTLNPPATYSWEVDISGNVLGANPGVTSNVIHQQLTNLATSSGTVTYSIVGTADMCETPVEEFSVTIRPEPTANMSLVGPDVVCRGETTDIRFDFIGSGPFVAEYEINGVPQPPLLSETSSNIVSIPVFESGVVTFVRYSDRNCTGNPNGVIPLTVIEPGEYFLSTSICEGESIQVGMYDLTLTGFYTFVLENASENGCDSIVVIELEVFDNKETDLELHICEGQSVTIGNSEYAETGFYSDTLDTSDGCDSVVNLLLTVSNEIIQEQNRVICAGTRIDFRGQTLVQDGTYYDTVAITPTCDSIFILNLNVLDVIVLIQTVIEPDTGQNSGSIMIQVAGGIPPYNFLWSTGDTTTHPMQLGQGNYSLTVTDLLGCSADFNFFLISATEDLPPGFREIRVFPNPAAAGSEVKILVSRDSDKLLDLGVELKNIEGRFLMNTSAVLNHREEFIILGLPGNDSGVFVLQLTDRSTGLSLFRKIVVIPD